ncbi:UbiA family prenyltransferase [Bacteroidota bacterium]
MEKNNTNKKPLCVDLDGTIISTDTLLESMLLSAKLKPYILFLFPFWILKGRAYLKKRTADIAIPDVSLLPYKENVITYIKDEKSKGREIVLATATHKPIADAVAAHLGIFDKVLSTDNNHNLRSENKSMALVELYGERGFDYIGDSSADLAVWKSASGAILVEPDNSLLNKVKSFSNVIKVFERENKSLRTLIKEIRVYQWIKNILIFLPFLMAHKPEADIILNAFFAFLSFSFTASFVYVINDLLDLESDRQHPRKKLRPLASGALTIHTGVLSAPLLLLAGLAIGIFLLPVEFLYTLLIYLILTTTYSFYLKRIIILDVIILSCLYTIRLIAGANAVNVEASPWLLGFSIFLFLSLAIMKRYTELRVILEQNKSKTKGRGYKVEDSTFLRTIGPISGYLSVLILALYVNSEKVFSLYNTPQMLWLTLLCLLFWVSRIWLVAYRGKMYDDPIVFMAKDPVSYIVGLIVTILVIGAAI